MILDSNIIIYASNPDYATLRGYLRQLATPLYVSQMTVLETLGYHRLTLTEKEAIEDILKQTITLSVSDDVIAEAIRLRQQRRRSPGDAIIAATALLYDQPLLTNNVADFDDSPGLTVIPMASVLSFPNAD